METFAALILDASYDGWPKACPMLALGVVFSCAASVFFVLGRSFNKNNEICCSLLAAQEVRFARAANFLQEAQAAFASETEQLETRLANKIEHAFIDKRGVEPCPLEELQQSLYSKVDCVQLDLHVEMLQSRIADFGDATDRKVAEALRLERQNISEIFAEKMKHLAERFDERVDGLCGQFEREAIGSRVWTIEHGLAEARVALAAAKDQLRLHLDDAGSQYTSLREAVERIERSAAHEDPTAETKAESPDRTQQLENTVGQLVAQMQQNQDNTSALESLDITLQERVGVIKLQQIEEVVNEVLQKKAGFEQAKQLQEKLDKKITDQMRLLQEKIEEKPGPEDLESLRVALAEKIDAAQAALEEKAGVLTVQNLKTQVDDKLDVLRAEKGPPEPKLSKAKQLHSTLFSCRDAPHAQSSQEHRDRDTLPGRFDYDSVSERLGRDNVAERINQLRREVRAGAASGSGTPRHPGGDASGGIGRMRPESRSLGQPLRYGHFGIGPFECSGSTSAAQTRHFQA